MTKKILFPALILVFAIIMPSCCKKITKPENSNPAPTKTTHMAGPPVIIYKTKKEYSNNVPVILSADKKMVVSYPGIKDIYTNGKFATPTLLENGYLLDNRGIGPDVAFLTLTYEAYSKLPATPKPDDFMKMILDADPLTEMYNCGTRYQYQDLAEELNKAIRDGKLGEFKKLK